MDLAEVLRVLSAFARYRVEYILARLGETVRFADLEADDVEVEGVKVRVATPRTPYRMKRHTVRPQDRIDAELIRRRFDLEDE